MLQKWSWRSHAAWSSLPLLDQQDSSQRPHGHLACLIHHEGALLQAAAPGLAPTQAQQVACVHRQQCSDLQGRHSKTISGEEPSTQGCTERGGGEQAQGGQGEAGLDQAVGRDGLAMSKGQQIAGLSARRHFALRKMHGRPSRCRHG